MWKMFFFQKSTTKEIHKTEANNVFISTPTAGCAKVHERPQTKSLKNTSNISFLISPFHAWVFTWNINLTCQIEWVVFSHIHLGQYQPKTPGRWRKHSKLRSEGQKVTKRIQNQGNIFSTEKSLQRRSSDKTSTLISSAASITYSSRSPLPPLPLLLWLLRATRSRLFQTWNISDPAVPQVNGNTSSILNCGQIRHRWGSDDFCGISSH